MKNNKGVTLISLVVAIIAAVILAGVAIYVGLRGNYKKTKDARAVNEAVSVYEAILNRKLLCKLDSNYNYVGHSIGTEIITLDNIQYGGYDYFRITSPEEFEELGLTNIQGSYLVNYDLEIVVSMDGIQYNGSYYYRVDSIVDELHTNQKL